MKLPSRDEMSEGRCIYTDVASSYLDIVVFSISDDTLVA